MFKRGLHNYYNYLLRVLRGIALRIKLLIATQFLLRLAAVFLVSLIGSYFVQQAKEVFPYLPFVYYLLALVSLAFLFLLGLWKTASRLSVQRVARRLEEKFPRLRDDVTNSLLLFHQVKRPSGSDQISGGLVAAHLRKTADKISEIHPKQVVSFRKVLPLLRLLLPLFLAFVVIFALYPRFYNSSLASIFHPLSALPPRKTSLTVEPAPSIVLRGTPVAIKAMATGYIPDSLSIRLWPEGNDVIHLDMEPEGNGSFIHRIASVQTSFRYQVSSSRAISPVYYLRVVDAPDIGKMKLTLIPPGYTRLPREIREGGHIEALKGTVVNLEVWATKVVREGKLVLNQRDQHPIKVAGDKLKGSFLVFFPGTYSLRIRDELGFENFNPVQYRIQLIPDKYPEGEIISPAEDLEVSGNEVLSLIFTAKDDFGVTAIRLIYQMAGKERSITLKNPRESRSTGPEAFLWDLSDLALTPGDRVAYRLEVWDNDSISGPKSGYSRTFTLQMWNEKDRTHRDMEQAQEISGALMDLLADQLEDVKDRKALSEEIARIMEKIDRYLERMGTEMIERYDVDSLKRNLNTLNRRIEELPRETITQEMERLALLAEDLVDKAGINEVEALARELRNRQRRLIDALRDHKGPLTPDALQSLLKELEKLKELISQVMETLSRMATQFLEEFTNSPELSELDFQDMFKDLEEIQKKLMEGDLTGALELAQSLLKTLSEMMAAMAKAGAQARTGSFDRLQSEMSRKVGELEKILQEQKEILNSTESIDRELKRLMEEETERRLKGMMSRLQEIMEQLQRMLPSEELDPILEMEKLLKDGKFERLSEIAKNLERELAGMPDILELLDELMRMMKDLTPDQPEVLGGESKEKFPGLSSRQKKLQERTRELGEIAEMLSQLFPGMDTEIINDLKDAADSMGRASERLKGEDASGAIPPEEEAIRSLSRSQQSMQQMEQQMAMLMQANRWGYPWGYDTRPGWYYGPRVPMPTLPQPEVERPLEQGYTGIDREEFDPPSRDAYKAPRILREKVMEALKEDIPSQYRREVERYFRGLTE